MSKYYVDFDGLKEKYISEKIEIEKIEEAIKLIESNKQKLQESWIGEAANSFYLKMDEYINELNEILDMLKNSMELTDSFYNKYHDSYNKIKDNFEKLQERVDEKWEKQ